MFALPRTLRYLVFSLFIIFSAVISSVGVWNRSLAQDGPVGWNSNVDLYLIFLGCLGLVVIFAVIFTELAWRHGISGRVWFECTWIGIFWLLYLTAAASLTVLFPARSCVMGFRRLTADACTSGRVLLGISWAMCVILFFYMSFLTFAALSHQHDDPDIWHSYVHKLSWKTQQRNLPSNPPTPSVPRFMPKMPALVAPKPKHLVPSQMYNTGRFGLGSEYEVEGYATPAPSARGPAGPLPPPGRLAAHSSLGLHIPPEPSGFGTSFYAHGVQSVLTPLEPVRPDGHRPQLPPSPPSPPPLGNWPRTNPPVDSVGRRRPVPPGPSNSFEQPQSIPLSGTSPPRERPLGPRRRSEQDGRTHQYSTSTSLQR